MVFKLIIFGYKYLIIIILNQKHKHYIFSNKLKCQKTLTSYNFGQNGQNANFFCAHHQASEVTATITKIATLSLCNSIWPVLAMFSALSAYQTTGIGVVIVGKGQGTGRVDLWSG